MSQNPPWAEAVQLVPVISLALPIIVHGEVDLSGMAVAFAVAAVLAGVVSGGLVRAGHLLNPIAVGTGVWLAVGAVGFGLPIPPLARALAEVQGFGLFLAAWFVAMGTHLWAPHGAIGARGEADWIRSRSAILLICIAVATVWAWWLRHDVRVGGGLPFIVVNVVRRLLIARG